MEFNFFQVDFVLRWHVHWLDDGLLLLLPFFVLDLEVRVEDNANHGYAQTENLFDFFLVGFFGGWEHHQPENENRHCFHVADDLERDWTGLANEGEADGVAHNSETSGEEDHEDFFWFELVFEDVVFAGGFNHCCGNESNYEALHCHSVVELHARTFEMFLEKVGLRLINCGGDDGEERDKGAEEVELDVVYGEQTESNEQDTKRSKCVCRSFLILEKVLVDDHAWNCTQFRKLVETNRVHFQIKIHCNNRNNTEKSHKPA